jgi:hypothetical protein
MPIAGWLQQRQLHLLASVGAEIDRDAVAAAVRGSIFGIDVAETSWLWSPRPDSDHKFDAVAFVGLPDLGLRANAI